ncbi:MAG: tRNA preQ1(34) S-adenosylmethionine ribosyltransferase-isomerase QueA [Rickettsiales bacterium]|nr:tRNA preQ1(34) S-adenosylmethionine ribosyltransferase-isomerase QueA [Rickettsiales bacterium]
MRVDAFDFPFDPSHIADAPCEPRDACKLLHVCPPDDLSDLSFLDLPSLLREGDLLVFNDSKVIPARVFVTRPSDGVRDAAQVELLLHRAQADGSWSTFAKPGKKLKVGDVVMAGTLEANVKAKHENGEIVLDFNQSGEAFYATLDAIGHMPLPPYIKREDTDSDKADYQTIYAREPGSVAAPTAGLHFTDRVMDAIAARGVKTTYVTLHVGAGTFQPVKVEDTSEHVMHHEFAVLSEETAELINTTKANGGRVIPVGTTALRTLESAATDDGIAAFAADTGIFITPGYQFRIADALLTNFHLPKSTLFMLVSAFSGLDLMQRAYAHAQASGYRFFSYGDACFLERSDASAKGA